MKWMGIDYGRARIGLALYDETSSYAVPRGLTTLRCKTRQQAIGQIAELARSEGVSRLVVGIPLAPDGGVGVRASQTRNFARLLASRTQLPVFMQDERDSSSEALERLIRTGVPMKQRAERIDEMAAVVILERYVRSGTAHEGILPVAE